MNPKFLIAAALLTPFPAFAQAAPAAAEQGRLDKGDELNSMVYRPALICRSEDIGARSAVQMG